MSQHSASPARYPTLESQSFLLLDSFSWWTFDSWLENHGRPLEDSPTSRCDVGGLHPGFPVTSISLLFSKCHTCCQSFLLRPSCAYVQFYLAVVLSFGSCLFCCFSLSNLCSIDVSFLVSPGALNVTQILFIIPERSPSPLAMFLVGRSKNCSNTRVPLATSGVHPWPIPDSFRIRESFRHPCRDAEVRISMPPLVRLGSRAASSIAVGAIPRNFVRAMLRSISLNS